MSTEYIAGNIFVRQMFFDDRPGMVVDGHAHNFDHVTYIAKGSATVELLDDAGNVVKSVTKKASDGFNWVLIKAGKRHRITALEAGTVGHCIYSHRNPIEPDVVTQEWHGWDDAYR